MFHRLRQALYIDQTFAQRWQLFLQSVLISTFWAFHTDLRQRLHWLHWNGQVVKRWSSQGGRIWSDRHRRLLRRLCWVSIKIKDGQKGRCSGPLFESTLQPWGSKLHYHVHKVYGGDVSEEERDHVRGFRWGRKSVLCQGGGVARCRVWSAADDSDHWVLRGWSWS